MFLPHKKTRVVDITVDATQPLDYIVELDRVCQEVTEAVAENYQFIVLSDKAADLKGTPTFPFHSMTLMDDIDTNLFIFFLFYYRIPLSALLTLGAVHHHLIEERLRMKVALILETAEAR